LKKKLEGLLQVSTSGRTASGPQSVLPLPLLTTGRVTFSDPDTPAHFKAGGFASAGGATV